MRDFGQGLVDWGKGKTVREQWLNRSKEFFWDLHVDSSEHMARMSMSKDEGFLERWLRARICKRSEWDNHPERDCRKSTKLAFCVSVTTKCSRAWNLDAMNFALDRQSRLVCMILHTFLVRLLMISLAGEVCRYYYCIFFLKALKVECCRQRLCFLDSSWNWGAKSILHCRLRNTQKREVLDEHECHEGSYRYLHRDNCDKWKKRPPDVLRRTGLPFKRIVLLRTNSSMVECGRGWPSFIQLRPHTWGLLPQPLEPV